MTTTTITDVRDCFTRMLKAASEAGIDVRDVALIEGSPTYGRPFRIVRVHPIDGGHYDWDACTPYVGSTRRECAQILRALTRAFYAISDGREATAPRWGLHRDGEEWPAADDARRYRSATYERA